jgi:hypothetical protein
MENEKKEVRQVKITGGAADDYTKTKRSKSRKKTKTPQEGGDMPPGNQITSPRNINSARKMMEGVKIMKAGAAPLRLAGPSTLPGSNPPNPENLKVPAVNTNLAMGIVSRVAPQPQPPLTQNQGQNLNQGGGKLTLVPSKKLIKKSVILAPPASKSSKHKKGAHQTRKIRVQLGGLKKRITQAKAIHRDSREKSIPDIRKLLEEAKLVKPAKEGKKVPDSVLRDIYKDYLLLRNKAL